MEKITPQSNQSPVTLENALLQTGATLCQADLVNGQQEAVWMLEELLQAPAGSLRSRLADTISAETVATLANWTRRRIAGEPLQYILGNVDFYNVRLAVGPGCLIPRPETEELVEEAVRRAGKAPACLCDLCTGSGAIALALARQFPHADIHATDISPDALYWARQNTANLNLTNVTLYEGDLFAPLPPGLIFDIITANPPYVSPAAYDALEPVVRNYEPEIALRAADDGLAILRRIAAEAPSWLRPGGWLLCEIGDEQGQIMKDLLRRLGYTDVRVLKDLAGQDRIAIARTSCN